MSYLIIKAFSLASCVAFNSMDPVLVAAGSSWFRRQLAEMEKKQTKEDEWTANTAPARIHLEMDLGDGLYVSNPNFHWDRGFPKLKRGVKQDHAHQFGRGHCEAMTGLQCLCGAASKRCRCPPVFGGLEMSWGHQAWLADLWLGWLSSSLWFR